MRPVWYRSLFGLMVLSATLGEGCLFGPNRGPRVLGYRPGRVLLIHDGAYRIGHPPPVWRRFRTPARAVSWRHAGLGATISTDAFCGAAYEDLPLPTLMGHLFAGFPTERVLSTTPLRLDGREALRQVSRRSVDGVVLTFDAVVVKKHTCLFDFVLMVPPPVYDAAVPDFVALVDGFAYD